MSKIFRLHTGTTQNIEHWQQLPNYIDHNTIDTIQDPSGLNAQTQITSIPSPFARMDLVKSSFSYVTSNKCLQNAQNDLKKALDGRTIYHRMISDCLDIAEIFFNIEALQNKIEILEWNSGIHLNGGVLDIDAESDLGRLINSSNPKHKLLGETLKMYLIQDKKHFNFADLKHIYLLNYKNGPEPINIIGGTSPTTLFFSSANDLSYVDISFANDKLFDLSFCPLHKRTNDFIKYLFTIQKSFPNFSEKFSGFNKYLEQTFTILDSNLQHAIRDISADSYQSTFNNIQVKSAGNFAEILGFKLKAKKYDIKPSVDDNDFIIEATKSYSGDLPCILPIDVFNEELKYGGGRWQKDWYKNVPKVDNRPITKRTLPNQVHIEYPYLTVSDLLEPYIIKVPYPTDNDKFFNGNYEIRQGEQDHGFILPIKKEFFNYFSINDLQGVVPDGKKMFEIKQAVGGVTAILRIPIKNSNYIQISRDYLESKFSDRIQQADEEQNKGVIIENQFTVAIYPFIRISNEINPHYRIMLVDRDVQPINKHFTYSLNFYSEMNAQTSLPSIPPTHRSSKHQSQKVTTNYYVVEKSYDFIEVKHNTTSGIIIPLFKPVTKPSKTFKFAVDFGTTNTHIEYKENGGASVPFDISSNDTQIGTLYQPSNLTDNALSKTSLGFGADDLINIIKEEFGPLSIDKDSLYKFPQRTVINDNGSFNVETNFALADFNIPFWYLKEDYKLSSTITSNLKWIEFRGNNKAERRTRAFLKQLMMMMRNKVLLNGGSLDETEIVWFYPSSMPTFRRKQLETAWTVFYERYFGNHKKLYKLSESFAPFYYYYHKEGVKPHDRPAINIDIGGGTTDIVIYKSETPILLSSFRFAANSIFGDGYGYTSNDNGFVQKYEPIIKNSLSNTSAKNLLSIYDSLKQKTNNSIELCEFFFSIEENKIIRDNKIALSFSKLLSEDNDLKLVFVFFYTAIIYHVANLMKTKNLPIPQFITFSGNGSKLIKIASGGKDLSTLKDFTKVIFNDVYGSQENISLEFRMFDNPKEITCKGGLECRDYSKFEALEKEILNVLIGIDKTSTIPSAELKYNQIENDGIKNQVKAEAFSFIDTFFGYNSKFNFFENFGINPKNLEKYKLLLKENIANDLVSGIKEKIAEANDNVDINIEETLFFYPLKGCINRLANQIHNDNK
jgi:hypothetical protein